MSKILRLGLFLYNIFLALYSAGIRVAALWNPKARLWVKGRRLQTVSTPPAGRPVVWMHCASLGEFEQGRPLLEAVKKNYPQVYIILSFFSPSGYEIRKNYAGADQVLYLPMDNPIRSRQFIDTIQPSLVLWVKYEYWYHYLSALKRKNIPVLLVSGIFRQDQPFFQWYGGFWKNILGSFEHLFVQTEASRQLLQNAGIMQNITVSGDTRFDRVSDIAAQWQPLSEAVAKFCEGHQVIVAGSTWEEDEEVLIHYARIHPHIRFIFAPHEVSRERIRDLKEEFPDGILFSELNNRQLSTVIHSNVLIIDNIGMLSRLYHYAGIAYIGGGFNQSGIHNILEAAVYGKPVVFGPVYEKFAEARQLVELDGAFSIENALELEALLDRLFAEESFLRKAGEISGSYVQQQCGATQTIMDYIQRKRLLTS
ncbi:MAG: glycosyltransferase N-terminal domain-containing protein [Ferruginibacter sp.]